MKDTVVKGLLDHAERGMIRRWAKLEQETQGGRVVVDDVLDIARYQQVALDNLIEAIRYQDARIAALEAARAPHGLPLEGTGPLPLERKEAR